MAIPTTRLSIYAEYWQLPAIFVLGHCCQGISAPAHASHKIAPAFFIIGGWRWIFIGADLSLAHHTWSSTWAGDLGLCRAPNG
jgi:hypothetical protein